MTELATAIAAYGQARRRQPPLKMVVEVYDMLLTLVNRARAARIDGGRLTEVHTLSLVGRVLVALDGCLDRQDPRAQPLTRTLSAYYKGVLVQAHTAARSMGEPGLERYASVYRQLLVMRNAWASVAGVAPLPTTIAKRDDQVPDTAREEPAEIAG